MPLTFGRTAEEADPEADGTRVRADGDDPNLGGHHLPVLQADDHPGVGVPVGLQDGAASGVHIGHESLEVRPPVVEHHLLGKLLTEAVGPAALDQQGTEDKLFVILPTTTEVELEKLLLCGRRRAHESLGTPGPAPSLVVEAAMAGGHRLLVGGAGAQLSDAEAVVAGGGVDQLCPRSQACNKEQEEVEQLQEAAHCCPAHGLNSCPASFSSSPRRRPHLTNTPSLCISYTWRPQAVRYN